MTLYEALSLALFAQSIGVQSLALARTGEMDMDHARLGLWRHVIVVMLASALTMFAPWNIAAIS